MLGFLFLISAAVVAASLMRRPVLFWQRAVFWIAVVVLIAVLVAWGIELAMQRDAG